MENDIIHNPAHYTFAKIEPKDAIREWNLNFNLGNAVKYIVRHGKKPGVDAIIDLEKARQYIDFEIEAIKKDRAESFKKFGDAVIEQFSNK